jgi:hypothetical protein
MLKNLTEAEKQALGNLLYLVTHDEALNTRVRADYGAARSGNPDMAPTKDFAAALDSLYAKSCK